MRIEKNGRERGSTEYVSKERWKQASRDIQTIITIIIQTATTRLSLYTTKNHLSLLSSTKLSCLCLYPLSANKLLQSTYNFLTISSGIPKSQVTKNRGNILINLLIQSLINSPRFNSNDRLNRGTHGVLRLYVLLKFAPCPMCSLPTGKK